METDHRTRSTDSGETQSFGSTGPAPSGNGEAGPPASQPGNGLRITEIRIRRREEATLLGFVTVVLNGVLALHDMRIIRTPRRTFLAMPRSPNRRGERRSDEYHPICPEFRSYLEKTVLAACNGGAVPDGIRVDILGT